MTEQRRYRAYLLRLWQASSAGKPVWRASLESAQTRERRGFADLDSLFAFVERRRTLMLDPTIARCPPNRDGDVEPARAFSVTTDQPIATGDSPWPSVV